jgi:hypothetical protein
VAQSSSAKKVAKLASKGKGKKVRFSGGTVFPAAIVGVLLVMIPLVVYARQSMPISGEGAPRVGLDHWHVAYGVYTCDTFLPNLTGELGQASDDYQNTGVHSHDDGVIHWHAFTQRATGNRAKLGIFLNNYDVTVNDDLIEVPVEQVGTGQNVWRADDFTCNGQPTQVKVRVWDNYNRPEVFRDIITDFSNIRISKDAMAMTIAIVPKDADIPQPPSAPNLPTLGAVDGGDVPTTTSTTVAGASTTTVAGGSTTVASGGSTTTATSTVTTTVPSTTGG